MSEKDTLMKQIYLTGFALDEAVLFLDTHPCSGDAMQYYKTMQEYYQKAVREYEMKFGPLSSKSVVMAGDDCGCANNTAADARWSWVNEPWPWEGGDC